MKNDPRMAKKRDKYPHWLELVGNHLAMWSQKQGETNQRGVKNRAAIGFVSPPILQGVLQWLSIALLSLVGPTVQHVQIWKRAEGCWSYLNVKNQPLLQQTHQKPDTRRSFKAFITITVLKFRQFEHMGHVQSLVDARDRDDGGDGLWENRLICLIPSDPHSHPSPIPAIPAIPAIPFRVDPGESHQRKCNRWNLPCDGHLSIWILSFEQVEATETRAPHTSTGSTWIN